MATRDSLTWNRFCQMMGVLAICVFIISGILGIMTYCQVGKENMQTFALELKVMALSGLSALIGHYAGRLDPTPKTPPAQTLNTPDSIVKKKDEPPAA